MPRYFLYVQRISPVDMIVDHRREQVVRRGYRVEIAGKMQVNVLHGRDLSVAAARRAAFYAEHGTQRRFS